MKKVETGKILKAAGSQKSFAAALSRSLLRMTVVLLFITAGIYMLPAAAAAGVPVKFTYQGNLRQNGFLVNGTRSMVFRIYNSSDAPLGSELWTSVPAYTVNISTGVFRVTLEPTTITNWDNGTLWLELEIEGTRMSPREELTSSPYAMNSLMVSGKRYTTASSAPDLPNYPAPRQGDLWMDSVSGTLKFYNGTIWMLTSGSGIPGPHAWTHDVGSSDPITNLGPHNVSGAITFDEVGELRAAGSVAAITITTNAVVQGTLNHASNLSVGGAGYTVTFASSVSAGWFNGNGSGLNNLDATKITSGQIGGDRIAAGVLVSTHIATAAITRQKLAQSGCANGQVLKWDNSVTQWICADDNFSGAGSELDPISVHIQSTLQSDATFYVASGTVNAFTVNNRMDVYGPTIMRDLGGSDFLRPLGIFTPNVPDGQHGAVLEFGADPVANRAGYISFVGAPLSGNEYISIGIKNSDDILTIKGNRNVGIGAVDPWEPLEIYKNGGGAGVRFNSPGVAEYKIGVPAGESYLRITNTNALAKGQYTVQGITMDTNNNVGIGRAPSQAKFSVTGSDTQPYSLAVGTGTVYNMVVSTSGSVGIGTDAPHAKMEVTGQDNSGQYIVIFNSGTKIAAWLRNK